MEQILRIWDIDNELMKELSKDSPSYDFIDGLLSKGANINSLSLSTGCNCLIDIIYTINAEINKNFNPKLELIQFMVDRGADINSYDKEGFSVVHSCQYTDRMDLLEFILDKGANPNIIFKESGTPKDCLLEYWNDEGSDKLCLELLDKYGALFCTETRADKPDTYLNFFPFFRKKEHMLVTPKGMLDPLSFNVLNENDYIKLENFNKKIRDMESVDPDSSLGREITEMNRLYLHKAHDIFGKIDSGIIFTYYYVDFSLNNLIGGKPYKIDAEYHESYYKIIKQNPDKIIAKLPYEVEKEIWGNGFKLSFEDEVEEMSKLLNNKDKK